MSIYTKCVQFTEESFSVHNNECISLSSPGCTDILVPSTFSCQTPTNLFFYSNIYYICDIHLDYQIYHAFPSGATDTQVRLYVKEIIQGLFSDQFASVFSDSDSIHYPPIILFGGDIASSFDLTKLFFSEFIEYWNNLEETLGRSIPRYIYTILGNHELWEFTTLEAAYSAYKCLFDSLGIYFLHNSISWCGTTRFPVKKVTNKDTNKPQYTTEMLRKEDDCDEYERQMRHFQNAIIVGGIGFAGYNSEFNATNGIYRDTINREQEIQETHKWEELYHRALLAAKENHCILIVLTHTPITDWKKNQQPDLNCVYINGHNHRNYLYRDDDRNISFFADNQIGYKKKKIQFKQAYIHKRINPFAEYLDGFYEITTPDYLRFYDYMNVEVTGNGYVDRHVKKKNAKFYLVKQSGYYGFFLVSTKCTYICLGGRIKQISSCRDISRFYSDFSLMIDIYLKLLFPYRYAQEQIAKEVKSFGGSGTIHGCIIDVDFFNHISLNIDGSITYYNSPVYGLVKTYPSMLELLANNKTLEKTYRKFLESNETSENSILRKSQFNSADEFIQVDNKNSIYNPSRKINQLQRLFDKKILRDWNEELLLKEKHSHLEID